jgi:ADP-ribosylglycohydrolase
MAFGCILGAFIGDACGQAHEFEEDIIADDLLEKCMEMPGGGPWDLSGGQITDDSELAMSSMNGII